MLRVSDLHLRFDDTPILRGVNLEVRAGEIVCLLGESGSGKTTLLRAIAGLEHPCQGELWLGGAPLRGVPVHRRGIGLMFQDFALFPHLNVAQNVAFGLRMQGIPRREREHRVAEALALVGLSGFGWRDVASLSGGERQRVALARSLAPRPRLILLDEPLSSLDATLRERLAVELRAIITQAGLTAITVTHDQQEAYALADRIAVLHHGRVEQIDPPETLYRYPRTVAVARFLGLTNVLLPASPLFARFAPPGAGGDALLLHPDGLHPDPTGDLTVTVSERVYRGGVYRLRGCTDDAITLTFSAPPGDLLPDPGDLCRLRVEPWAIIRLGHSPDETSMLTA